MATIVPLSGRQVAAGPMGTVENELSKKRDDMILRDGDVMHHGAPRTLQWHNRDELTLLICTQVV